MKRENRLMTAVMVISFLSFFLFTQEGEEKLPLGSLMLIAAGIVAYNVYNYLKRRSWEDRRFGLLCSGMGVITAVMILLVPGFKSNGGNSGNGVLWEGCVIFALVLAWCIFCIWAEKDVTENVVLLILFGGFLIRIFYVVLTAGDVFQNDSGELSENYEHLGYVYYLYKEGHLPDINPMYAYQFYHPPLYHAVSAVFVKLFAALGYGMSEAREQLQVLSALYGTLTLFYVNKIGIRLRFSARARGIGLGLAAFLPFGIMMGGLLNNDGLMVLLAVMALYYTLVWYEKPEMKTILIMALCIGGSMMAKLSGAVVAPAMAVMMLYKAWTERKQWRVYLKQFICFGVIAFPLGLWYSVLRLVQYGMPIGYILRPSEYVVHNVGRFPKWSRFFDFGHAFDSLSVGWDINTRVDINIPITLVKFAVFGEEDYYQSNPALYVAGTGLFWATLVLAVLVAVACIQWMFRKKNSVMERIFISLAVAAAMYSYVKFNFAYPFVCTMHIRYIMIAVYIGFLVFGAVAEGSCEALRVRKPLLSKAAVTMLSIFTAGYIAGAVTLIVQIDQLFA